MLTFFVALALFLMMPSVVLAQEEQRRASTRWNLLPPNVVNHDRIHAQILQGLRHHNKFGDNRSIFEIVNEQNAKDAIERQAASTGAGKSRASTNEMSPLEQFKAAFGKPAGHVTAVPVAFRMPQRKASTSVHVLCRLGVIRKSSRTRPGNDLQNVEPDPSLQKYYQRAPFAPPPRPPKSSSMVWPDKNHF